MGRRALALQVLLALAVAAGANSNSAPSSATDYAVDSAERTNDNEGFIGALLHHGGYTSLADALVNRTSVAAEMRSLLSAGEGLTLLAPSDAAMARHGSDPAHASPLQDILRYHVLRLYLTAEDIDGALRRFGTKVEYIATLRRPPPTFVAAKEPRGSVVFFGQGYVSAANLSDPDVYTDGRISVQGIDAVLFMPQDEDRAPPPAPHVAGSETMPPALSHGNNLHVEPGM